MACISIDASWLLILLGGMYEFWRTGRVTGLELFVVGSGIAAAVCGHKPRPFWFLLGTGFARYQIERKISVCTAPVAHTTTRAISY
jgi:hypothetical protein